MLELNGSVRPCFFHPPIGNVNGSTPLEAVLTGPAATRFRDTLDVAANPTCRRCLCSPHYKESSPAHSVDEAVSV